MPPEPTPLERPPSSGLRHAEAATAAQAGSVLPHSGRTGTAELTAPERLQPCLLDRLTDDAPTNPYESRTQRVVNMQQYQRGVLRDLEWLFSTLAHTAAEGEERLQLANYPYVARSVLNYGTRQLVGLLTPNLEELEAEMLEALQAFEPRILAHNASLSASKDRNWIRFELRGDLWADPRPSAIYFRTQLDLESGQCLIGDRAHG